MKKRKEKAVLFAALAAFGILLITISAYFLFARRIYKTHHNEGLRYVVKYPSDWIKKEGLGGTSAMFFSPKENNLDFFQENVSIVVQDISEHPMRLKEYTDLAIRQVTMVFRQYMEIVESKPAFFGGYPGHEFVFVGKSPEGDLKYKIMWTLKGSMAYQMSFSALETKYDSYIKTANKMFRSFRIR